MINDKALVIVAIIAAVGLLGLAVIETMTWQQQAEAAKSVKGECASSLKNASSSFCHRL
jgi:Tfp pilus assembly protein PilV